MGFGHGVSPENPETEGQDVPGDDRRPPRWTRKRIKRGCGGGKGGVVLGLEAKILRAAAFSVRSCDAEGFDVVDVKNQQTRKKKEARRQMLWGKRGRFTPSDLRLCVCD